jgi:histidinol dehydrogenase
VTVVADVKARGLEAVREWAVKLDGVEPARAVPDEAGLPREVLLTLADRVRRWHALQRPADITLEVEPGVVLERRWIALDTIGVYVPRGLISTLVICAVPAQVAGVRRIVVCTPPSGAPLIAAAAEALGVDEVWAIGGAQAIAWLAYVERVDKIVGPGNSYVNEAKREAVRSRRRRRRRRACDLTRARGAGRARPRLGLPARRDRGRGGGACARASRSARRCRA